MIVHLAAVGRVRQAGVRQACDEYAGRLRRYLRLEIHEVPERSARGRPPDQVRRLESESLRRAVPDRARVFVLSRTGVACDSIALAGMVAGWQRDARDVALVVGGAFGVDLAALAPCEARLSLSALTLPHELARLVLLEQLYRAGTILRGEPYHKSTDRPARPARER